MKVALMINLAKGGYYSCLARGTPPTIVAKLPKKTKAALVFLACKESSTFNVSSLREKISRLNVSELIASRVTEGF